MSKDKKPNLYNYTEQEVTNIMRQLPEDFDLDNSGIIYRDGYLEVPVEYADLIEPIDESYNVDDIPKIAVEMGRRIAEAASEDTQMAMVATKLLAEDSLTEADKIGMVDALKWVNDMKAKAKEMATEYKEKRVDFYSDEAWPTPSKKALDVLAKFTFKLEE